jgi:outer membrane protein TolC
MNLKISISLFLLCLGLQSWGQQALTATQAVFIALENNYQVQIAARQVAIAEKNNSWGEAGLFPTVNLVVAQNNVIQDNTNNPFTFTPGIILNQSINPSLVMDWNIFSGFQVRMSKQRLEQLEAQSANNALAVMETTIQDVLKAYYTAQLQKDRSELFRGIMELSRKRVQYYELKEKYSTSNSLELLQFKNQYLTDSTNYRLQLLSHQNALRNLSLLMNEETPGVYVLTDKLDAMLGKVDTQNALNAMLESNANLKNQYIALELQQTNTAFRRSFLYPTLSFQAGVQPGWAHIREIKNDSFEAETNTLSYYGNFNLRYTLFNNWKNKRAVEVSKIQEEIATLNIDQMKATLGNTLQNLIDLYQTRQDMVRISEENLIYAQKAFDMAQKRFDLGSLNSIELTSFQNAYQNTMIQHLENLFNRLDTYLEIYKMTGKIGLEYQP